MSEREIHLLPRNISFKTISEFLFPNMKSLPVSLREMFRRQATSSLMLVMFMALALSIIIFIFVLGFYESEFEFSLAKSLIFIFGFFAIVLVVHKISKNNKLDFFLLGATVVFIASWGVAKDIINFGIPHTSFGMLYISILFFGLIFMPFAPKISLFLGLYCAVLYLVMYLLFVEMIFGSTWFEPLKNLFGIEWLSSPSNVSSPTLQDPEFLVSWRILEYLSFGLIAFVFRSANIRSLIKAFKTDERLQDAEIEIKAVQALLARKEDIRLEFKSSARWDYKANRINKEMEQAVVKTIAGFMNSEGGLLLLGVDDDGNPLGLTQDIGSLARKDNDGFEAFLIKLISDHIGAENCANISITFIEIDGKNICAIETKANEKPIFIEKLDGAFFIRTGNNTRQLNPREAMEYIARRWKK